VHQRIVSAAIARDVPFQRAELLGEGDLLILAQALTAEAQHLVAAERVVDPLACRGIQRLRQVQPDDLRAEHRRQLPYVERAAGFHHH